MTKKEIIESLYKSGKITFEEAITLASVPGEEPLVTFKDGGIVEPKVSKEQTIRDFIKEIVDECYLDGFGSENLAFNSVKCVEAMDVNNWKWAGIGVPNIQEFKAHLRNEIKVAIDDLLKQYKEKGLVSNLYCATESGGIKVEGWIEIEQSGPGGVKDLTMTIKPQFILEQGEFILDNDKVKILLN